MSQGTFGIHSAIREGCAPQPEVCVCFPSGVFSWKYEQQQSLRFCVQGELSLWRPARERNISRREWGRNMWKKQTGCLVKVRHWPAILQRIKYPKASKFTECCITCLSTCRLTPHLCEIPCPLLQHTYRQCLHSW